ncbi:MAG TPA: type I DNA topoisomerase, partial [Candidatus Paceibacterota bacterium]|nr:type I DNA topoisomerase [Candidatus Paceibacterota bacterium]
SVISEIKNLAKNAGEVLLATDPDREGEAIAWHIAEAAGLKHPKRVVFHEITKDAIIEALKHPRGIDMDLKEAQEARRVLDRLVGYDLSGLIWKKVRYGLSAGRVQSPALRILMEREREIRAFISHKFWVITADVKNKKNDAFILECTVEPTEKKETERILEHSKKGTWIVKDVAETEAKRTPRPPFITSTLQQAASSRLGFSPSNTMRIAQKLYEAGLITYMRTDSTNLSKVAVAQAAKVVEKKYGKELVAVRTFAKKSKNAQEAHEAIRPTDLSREMAGFAPDQQKLYKLIWARTLASQMADAKILRTKMIVEVDKGSVPDFAINGARVLQPGWLLADPAARGEDVELPKVDVGEELSLVEMHDEEKETQPPSRYTEAGLVKELEKRGIGRPSTYASIIKTLQDRGYVTKEGRTLIPTDTGDVVSSFLEKYFEKYVSDNFTAFMEDKLDDISEGKTTYEKVLKEFYAEFLKDVKSKEKIDKITNLGAADPSMKCPVCGSGMIVKLGKSGKFLSCERFPDCTGARTIEGKEMTGPKDTGEICPRCGEGTLVEREGRFGAFIACSRYPKCKFIKEDEEKKKAAMTGVKCPVCGTGEMMEKRGRFGTFYACSNYPECKNAIKAKPTGAICPLCNSLMMEGTKTIPERCSNKACPNHNPHKIAK